MQSLAQQVIIFTIYSFIGWVCETIFCSVPKKKFVDRGFLNGPFCPIYGFGALIVIDILSPFEENVFLLFFSSVIVTTAIEYVTGVVLEKIFHTTWWDYSENKFNFQGRICLTNSLLFGVMCVVGIQFVHPIILDLVNGINHKWAVGIGYALVAYFICDTIITLHTIAQLKGKLEQLQQVLDEIKAKTAAMKDSLIEKGAMAKAGGIKNLQNMLDNLLDDDAKSNLNSLYEKKEKVEKEFKYMQRRIIRAFPTMKSNKNNESLSRIKEMIWGKIGKR
ncbi:MAG TPA: putative ABC transporter permease [Oscillospiraceae bacterium]|nr:putative ABC transporter permease [Oscillospiraceae bacterium]